MKILYLIYLSLIFTGLEAIKLDRVILSSDINPTYIQFWPIVAKAWKELIGVRPTLALIGPKNYPIDKSIGDVIIFEPIPNIPTSMQAQVIRLLLPAYFENDVCIISDIDMLPLNKDYFCNSISEINNNDGFIVYRDQAYGKDYDLYPMCYVAASGKTFKEIFKINNDDDIKNAIIKWHSFGFGWHTDEMVMYRYLNNWEKKEKNLIKLGHKVERRLCRSNWQYNSQQIKDKYYIDSHMLRPYYQYKNQIDEILRLYRIKN